MLFFNLRLNLTFGAGDGWVEVRGEGSSELTRILRENALQSPAHNRTASYRTRPWLYREFPRYWNLDGDRNAYRAVNPFGGARGCGTHAVKIRTSDRSLLRWKWNLELTINGRIVRSESAISSSFNGRRQFAQPPRFQSLVQALNGGSNSAASSCVSFSSVRLTKWCMSAMTSTFSTAFHHSFSNFLNCLCSLISLYI